MNDFRNATSIIGIGCTDYTRSSGKTVEALAIEAARNAIADAGCKPEEIDGIITYGVGDTVPTSVVATGLALPEINHYADYSAGGNMAAGSLLHAAMAVHTGQARSVLVYRALNGSSGVRYGGKYFSDLLANSSIHSDSEAQFLDTCGVTMPAQHFALLCRRHMIKYGTTNDHLAAVALTFRKHAEHNTRAMMRKPLTKQDYDNGRWIAEPFRVFDCCLQSDGACALIVTSTDRAKEFRQKPVTIRAGITATGPSARGGMWGNFFPDHADSYARYAADRLYKLAGLGPKEIDLAQLYDCFSYSSLVQLEDFGFCKKGEGGPFFADGKAAIGGELPVNTGGGMLSEAYIHGLNLVVEAVEQLRGTAGARQVKDAEIALSTAGGAASTGSAIILQKGH